MKAGRAESGVVAWLGSANDARIVQDRTKGNIELQAVAGVIERQRGMDKAAFYKKLDQMAEVLSKG